ncbi:MAG: NAD-dependent epimerase/dehydratase family protein [Chthonomonadales bacterium]|nr:NAD-dependent epimerase/dehydratase family protein [Chthonomonadales bacterium]
MDLKRALVTGATGFVGFHIARILAEGYRPPRVLVRPDHLARHTGPLTALIELGCCIVPGDVLDTGSLTSAMADCEVVFHAAADYRLWCPDPDSMYRTNVEGTENVLRAAHDCDIQRIVYTSTVGTLGIPRDGTPGNEETPVTIADMAGHYKRSKYIAERRARELADENALDLVVVHPSTPIGERDVKPTPTGRIIVDFLNGRMPAFVDTGLNLVDVRDVAVGHVLAAEKGRTGRSYILGCANMTLRQILESLASISGRRAPRARLPYSVAYGIAVVDTLVNGTLRRREPRASLESVRMAAKHMCFDSSRAVRELGLPQSPVEAALRRAVEWFRLNGYAR